MANILKALDIIEQKYKKIKEISSWEYLSKLNDLGTIDKVLRQRQELINEISDLYEKNKINENDKNFFVKKRKTIFYDLVQEISSYDRVFMQKIQERMDEIKEKLRSNFIIKKKAIKSYMLHQKAFVR